MFRLDLYQDYLIFLGTDKVPNGRQGWYIKRGTPLKIKKELEKMAKDYRRINRVDLIRGYEPKKKEQP